MIKHKCSIEAQSISANVSGTYAVRLLTTKLATKHKKNNKNF